MAAKVVYRVIRIDEATRTNVKRYRDKTDTKNHEAIAAIVETAMPLLIKGLAELGIVRSRAKTRAARLPFAPENLTILKSASDKTGLPAVTLLKAALASARPAQPKRGRRAAQ
jgi:hypothetical protein